MRSILILIAAAIALFAINTYTNTVDPLVGSQLAAATVNGGSQEFINQRLYTQAQGFGSTLQWGLNLLILLILLWHFVPKVMTWGKKVSSSASLFLLLLACSLTSCMKPYNTPEFVEVKPSETAFVIPVAGDSKEAQVQMDSKSYEQFKKVGIKQITIPKEERDMGRGWANVKWVPTVKIIKVDRSSTTLSFVKTSSAKDEGNYVVVESSDSVGFSMGFKVTGFIAEEDTATFLYYNAKDATPSDQSVSSLVVGLSEVMDTEVLPRIQKVAAEEFAKYTLDECRAKKSEVFKAIDADVIPFCKERGLTIRTIAQVGGMTYLNPKIQDAIDQTVIDQQLKVSAEAKFQSQEVDSKTTQAKAEAEAAATLTRAKAEAEGKFLVQEQAAKGMKMVVEASKEAGSSEAYLKLQEIEVMKIGAALWKGEVPATLIVGGKDSGVTPFLPLMPNSPAK